MPAWSLKFLMGTPTVPEAGIAGLLQKLQWPARDQALYEEALTHASYAHEAGLECSNERLEFLGDAVLGLVVSEYLYQRFPGYPEGKLTQIRHRIVNEQALADMARELNLGAFMKLGKGELLSGGSKKNSLLADALEALFGALFIDLGYQKTRELLVQLLGRALDEVTREAYPLSDHKTALQELCQSQLGQVPAYRIAAVEGPPHERVFRAEVILHNRVVGRGKGKSKKEAEQAAADLACKWFREQYET